MRKTGRSTLAFKKEKDTKLSSTINGIYCIGHLIISISARDPVSMPRLILCLMLVQKGRVFTILLLDRFFLYDKNRFLAFRSVNSHNIKRYWGHGVKILPRNIDYAVRENETPQSAC